MSRPLFPNRNPRSLEGSACLRALGGGWGAREEVGQAGSKPGKASARALSGTLPPHRTSPSPNLPPLLPQTGFARSCQALWRPGGEAQLTGAL